MASYRLLSLFVAVSLTSALSAQGVTYIPNTSDPVGDYARSLARQAEQRRQHEHEMEMARQRAEAERKLHAQLAAAQQSAQQPVSPATPGWVFERTSGMLNGRSWLSWAPEMKVMYVMGMYEAIFSTVNDPATREPFTSPLTYVELAEGIDTIFADPAMRAVPVKLAAIIYAAKSRGVSVADVEAMKSATLAALNK